MYIVKYSELVHMAEMQARASSQYELVPNILQYTLNNLYLFLSIHIHGNMRHKQYIYLTDA